MENKVKIMKIQKPDGTVQLMEGKTISKKEMLEDKSEDIKILGLAYNFNRDGKDYYVAKNSKGDYFLLVGSRCSEPSSSSLFCDFDDDYGF